MAFSFSYRGDRSENFDIDILSITRGIMPPSNNIMAKIPGKEGSFFIRNEYDVRTFVIEILVKKQPTLVDLQYKVREIADYLDSSLGLGELIFDDEPDKSYQAIISGDTNLEQIVRFRRGTITFLVPNPYAERLTEVSLLLNGASFLNLGTAVAYPIIEVNVFSTSTYVEVYHTQTDKFLRVEGNFNGSEIIFDNRLNLIYIDSIVDMSVLTLDSDFFGLVKGTNTVTVNTDAIIFTSFLAYKPRWV